MPLEVQPQPTVTSTGTAPAVVPTQSPEPEWVDSLPYLPESTAAAHCTMQGDQVIGPKPHRAQFHLNLITQAVESVPPVPYPDKPKAVLVIGGVGSGKSSVLGDLPAGQFVVCNPDQVKEQIHEYKDATKYRARNADQMVHAESSFLAKQIQRYALETRRNLVVESVGLDPQVQSRLVDDLQARGYDVAVVLTHMPVEDGVKRASEHLNRQGRYVPEATIRDSYESMPQRFAQVQAKVPNVRVVNTRDRPPTLVWSKSQGEQKVHSPQQMQELFNVNVPPNLTKSATRRQQPVPGRPRAATDGR